MLPRILTVAGSDSGGGAGIQADLKTIALLGGFGMSALTAVTAQNTRGVAAVQEIPAEFVGRQMETVLSDIGADAVKTGMLGSASVVQEVSRQIRRFHLKKVVVDPVMTAKGGNPLLSAEGIEALRRDLLPLSLVATPNLPEAEALLRRKIKGVKGMREAAAQIHALGAKTVLLKGGHLPGNPVDILFDGRKIHEFPGWRVDTPHTHGTGCTLSAAIACELAKGSSVRESVEKARAFTAAAIESSFPLGQGHGPVNPYGAAAREMERYRVVQELKEAFRILQEHRVGDLFPEVQANIGYALPFARGTGEVAAFPGRLVHLGKEVRQVADPEFGVSRHIAKIILTAMGHDPRMRSAMNLRFSDDLVKQAKKAGLRVAHFSREEEPASLKRREGSSLAWGVEQVLRRSAAVPDLIYDRGDVGKEPMVRILGCTPAEVGAKVLRLQQAV